MIMLAYGMFNLLLGAAIALAVIRLLRGPTLADRINAADVVAICVVGSMVGNAWFRGEPAMLDFALVAGLVLFVGTAAMSLFLRREQLSGTEGGE